MRRPRRLDFWDGIQERVFYGLGVVIFVSFAMVTLFRDDGLIDLMQLYQAKSQLVQQNYRLLNDNLRMAEEIKTLPEAWAMEQTIRTHMGLVRPDELVFVFDD